MFDCYNGCCGVGEIYEIDHIKNDEDIEEVLEDDLFDYPPDVGAVAFTEHATHTYGEKLAKYIEKNKLGKVVRSGNFKNPVHPHHKGVRHFLWILNRANVIKWCKKHDADRRKRERQDLNRNDRRRDWYW